MKRGLLVVALGLALVMPLSVFGADPVFSGPQAGEALPPLIVTSVLGESAGQQIDLIQKADGKPVMLIFFHARTRPAFGLTNTLMRYAAMRADDGLESSVIFLTDDATQTATWVRNVRRHFSPDVATYGISQEGQEGPGAYGLNRNMTLTVLVGKAGKVTANYALVQPSEQADGPHILKAVVEALGGGKVPTIAELGGGQYRNRMAAQMMRSPDMDDKLAGLLRRMINRQTTEKQKKEIINQVDAYVADKEDARKQLGAMAARAVASKRLDAYRSKSVEEALRKWAKEHGDRPADSDEKTDSDDKSESEEKSEK